MFVRTLNVCKFREHVYEIKQRLHHFPLDASVDIFVMQMKSATRMRSVHLGPFRVGHDEYSWRVAVTTASMATLVRDSPTISTFSSCDRELGLMPLTF